jgi:hypothetical protein
MASRALSKTVSVAGQVGEGDVVGVADRRR